MLKLPDSARSFLLRYPLGELFKKTEAAVDHIHQLKPVRLITIGDVVTAELIKAGVKPDVAVIDYSVMRSPLSRDLKNTIDSYDVPVVHVENPAGTITPELRQALKTVKPPVKIVVKGEEDLATLPAVVTASIGSLVIYGQPDQGMVLIKITEEKKREFEEYQKILKASGRV